MALLLFGTAFGYLEAAVVSYLRYLHEPIVHRFYPNRPPGELFPLLTREQSATAGPRERKVRVTELWRELARQGRRFRNFLAVEHWWHRETFQFLKGRSRVVSLADYAAEKSFILAVPHRVLIGTAEQISAENPAKPTPPLRTRRPRGLPF